MKNTAAKNAIMTMMQMVRKGTFDAKVFLMLLDLGLFSYRAIWDRGCRSDKPTRAGSNAATYFFAALRRDAAKPSRPMPSNAIEVGSGTCAAAAPALMTMLSNEWNGDACVHDTDVTLSNAVSKVKVCKLFAAFVLNVADVVLPFNRVPTQVTLT